MTDTLNTPCFACGRLVSARWLKRGPAGKPKVRHKCPHGVWCISGTPLGGQGYNRAPNMGKNSCLECHTRRPKIMGDFQLPDGSTLSDWVAAARSVHGLTEADDA